MFEGCRSIAFLAVNTIHRLLCSLTSCENRYKQLTLKMRIAEWCMRLLMEQVCIALLLLTHGLDKSQYPYGDTYARITCTLNSMAFILFEYILNAIWVCKVALSTQMHLGLICWRAYIRQLIAHRPRKRSLIVCSRSVVHYCGYISIVMRNSHS
jgi:hypothetical protein